MAANTRPRFNRSQFHANIEHHLKAYSLAAAAAGVGMMVLASPAWSEVVITKKTIPVVFGTPVLIDLNKDGIADFEFSFTYSDHGRISDVGLVARGLTGGKAVGGKVSFGPDGAYASALARGAHIGPSAHFSSSHGKVTLERDIQTASSSAGSAYYGNWYGLSTNRGKLGSFLGVKFQIKGETHYGWIRMSVKLPGDFTTEITAYAYETIPNKRIEAGNPSKSPVARTREPQRQRGIGTPSLGMLALGTLGLPRWRRDDPVNTK
jgi:hypothetical protein